LDIFYNFKHQILKCIVMKKILLTAACSLAAVYANAQITLFEDGFETYEDFTISNIGSWSTVDGDGLGTYAGGVDTTPGVKPWVNAYEPMAAQVFNPSVAGVQNGHDGENSNFNPHGGQKYIAFWAGVPASGVNKNNDWLISPKINLGDTGNQLSFWVKSLASDYGLEKYRVLIYVGEDAPANVSAFTPISGSTALSAPISWTQLNYNLDAYKNQPVRFAINYVSSDVYMMMFDDVKVTATTVLGTNEGAAKKGVRVYPNPSKGVFTLQSAKNVSKVQVFSADGRLITESKDATQVDLAGKAKGVYMMLITHDDGSTTKQQVIRN